jgi:hypothetical protein
MLAVLCAAVEEIRPIELSKFLDFSEILEEN